MVTPFGVATQGMGKGEIRHKHSDKDPKFGWMDGVKRALNDRRMDMREASERARNRNEWRMIVTQL